jgi:pimeloyl-ACP methyl ester carboxylesterase
MRRRLVQAEAPKLARVCSYDRAGYSWSDPSPLERTSANIAKELYTLLKKADIPGPYILVGHSFGGANMLLFADLCPQEVLGVILVDSVHEDMLQELPSPPHGFFDHPKIFKALLKKLKRCLVLFLRKFKLLISLK